MKGNRFALELQRHGPQAADASVPPILEASDYCRQLAKSHYENFTVASWFLPAQVRRHFYHIYAYCRWADDLADESPQVDDRLKLLDWWEDELTNCYRGEARHPVFVALANTVEAFSIPIDPFRNLLTAFRQDQQGIRYDTFDKLLGYCRNSANPVGEVILYLAGSHTAANVRLSNEVCTGLQLANFWQDVARDFDQDRVYLPLESCRRFGYDLSMLERREYNQAFRQLLEHEVCRARAFLQRGAGLVERLPKEFRLDVALFVAGGLAILAKIARQNYDVLARRPVLGKMDKLKLLWAGWRTK